MGQLDTFELVMMAIVILVASSALIRMMLARRDALIAEIKDQIAAQSGRSKHDTHPDDGG